jgi:hypothetical protein
MRLSFGAGGVVVLWAVSCGSSPSPGEPTAVATEAIQDGTPDTTGAYPFAVAILENSQQVGLCSGSLLAPNLVATARHCVTGSLSSPPQVDCTTSTFGSVVAPSQLIVTNDGKISPTSHFVGVKQIITPTGAQQTKVCGNDIALLILDQSITLSQYVTPTINPPMTDPRYSITVTAIGYGIDTPLDTSGMSAGVRRIHQNVALACVPNDPTFFGCYSEPGVAQFLSPDEFVSGNASTCEGDSGSGAFDQGSFDRGVLVSFGVLSRGAADLDSGICIQPVYSRFDAWGDLLVAGATQAASLGGYAIPAWARSAPTDAGDGNAGAVEAGTANASAADAGAAGGSTLLGDGIVCGADGDCQSHNCVSTNDVLFVCASQCPTGTCSSGFSCLSGYCFQAPSVASPPPSEAGTATSGSAVHKTGCSSAPIGGPSRAPRGAPLIGVAVLTALAFRRRRGRAAATDLA